MDTCPTCGGDLRTVPYKEGTIRLIINGKDKEINSSYCIFCNDVKIVKDEKLFKYNSFGQVIRID